MLIDHYSFPTTMSAEPVPKIRVAELFAGVGGFRLGLEGDDYEFVFSNQWEPGESKQWASKIYESRFGSEGHSNDDIHDIAFNEGEMAETIRERVPEHDLLVGGFPCQDYSVARTISGELGIKGEKGKLWIPIRNIIRHKRPRPKAVLLENVPRLLNSPANARGLNFAIILNDLIAMGYEVEWRVINAADYGMPQQRSRVFILAYRTPGKGRDQFKINGPERFSAPQRSRGPMSKWLLGKSTPRANPEWELGPFAEAFPVTGDLGKKPELVPQDLSAFTAKSSPFGNAGYAWKTQVIRAGPWVNVFWTTKVKADYEGERRTLGDVLVDEHDPDYEIIDKEKLRMYAYIKGEQKEWRIRKEDRKDAEEIPAGNGSLWDLYQRCTKGYDTQLWVESRKNPAYKEGVRIGIIYDYTAGAMAYPDPLDKASRTVVTAEIGKSVSRMRHVIEYEKGKFRGLMPEELEQLNMFPKGWTEYEGISDSKRGFLMGNALVVGIVEDLAKPLAKLIRDRREQ